MKSTRRGRGTAAQRHSQGSRRARRRVAMLLFVATALTLASILALALASSAQDSSAQDRSAQGSETNRTDCSNPSDDFVVFCLAFEAVVENFVDGVDVGDMADAAAEGLAGADLAVRSTPRPPCALPAPEFEAVCVEIDKFQDTGAAALVATRAMLASLNDSNTTYFPPMQARRFFSLLNAPNSRAGIGIEHALLSTDKDLCAAVSETCLLTITEVYDPSPAHTAGLKVGDVIIEYEKLVAGRTCRELAGLDDRGAVGETVLVVVRRDGAELRYMLETAQVVDPLVSSRIVDGSIGYIRLDTFAATADESFTQHLSDLLDAGVESLVVDLRNNPGGYLGVTEAIVDLFLEMGDLNHRTKSIRMDSSVFADSDGIASGPLALPMATVVDGGSASGSELFVLAMRGNGRAKIVGATTYGKSTGQLTFPAMSSTGEALGAVHVTGLRFFGPDGLNAAGGVEPDTVLELPDCAHPSGVAREAVMSLVPRISTLAITSAPAADAYVTGEKLTVAVTFDAPVVVDSSRGEPFLSVEVGDETRRAGFVASLADEAVSTVEFEYTINDDEDYDGISVGADSINLNGATIRHAAAPWDAHTGHRMLAVDPTQAVAADPDRYFVDIADTSFVDAVNWLRHAGITTGCGTNTYCPDQPVTRGQMAAFLKRALQLPAADGDYFNDDNDSPFQDDINRLRHAGITTGCATNTYCPDQPVTRGQMAAFLHRALQLAATDGDYFNDDNDSPFQDDINRLRHAGITTGCATNTYCPDQPVSRGQMAAFLYRARSLIAAAAFSPVSADPVSKSGPDF